MIGFDSLTNAIAEKKEGREIMGKGPEEKDEIRMHLDKAAKLCKGMDDPMAYCVKMLEEIMGVPAPEMESEDEDEDEGADEGKSKRGALIIALLKKKKE